MMSTRSVINLVAALSLALLSISTSTHTCLGNPTGNDTSSDPGVASLTSARLVPTVIIQQQQRPELGGVGLYDGGHHYEQPPNEQIRDGTKPLVHLMDLPMSTNNDADLYIGVSKPEPRNEIEDPVVQQQQQPQPQVSSSPQQQEPAIIDHRPPPSPPGQQQQQPATVSVSESQQPVAMGSTDATTSTQAPTSAPTAPAAAATAAAATSAPVVTYNVAPQIAATVAPPQAIASQPQQPQPPASPAQVSPATAAPATPKLAVQQPQNWYSGQPPLNYQQQQQQLGDSIQTGSASNQVLTSVQHPNSINAIITDNQARSMQQQQQSHQLQATPSQQVVTVNGQPMLLVNPNAMHTGGRRISISGWLKNISSILTNIFNRREHGFANPNGAQPAPGGTTSGGPLSHWMLGSGHSWLSGAQQMVQQPHLAHNRHNQPHHSYALQQLPGQAQQQLPVDLQASASSNSYATISSPPQPAVYQQSSMQMMQLSQQHQLPSSQVSATGVRQALAIPLQASSQQQLAPAPVSVVNQVVARQPSVVSPPVSAAAPAAAAVAPAATNQQPPVRTNRSPSNSGLPLAHYSRYSTNMD